MVEPLRAYGAYAAALPPRPADDSAAELLRYLGRDPQWSGAGQEQVTRRQRGLGRSRQLELTLKLLKPKVSGVALVDTISAP